MVNLEGTNPISGESVDATSPGTWINYGIGGIVLAASLMIGLFVTNTASEASGAGDTVSEGVMELT